MFVVVAFNRRHSFQGFPAGSACKESACSVGDLRLIPGLGRFPGERNNYPLQYSGLENSMDCIVHRVAESDTTERLLKKNSFQELTISSKHAKMAQSL